MDELESLELRISKFLRFGVLAAGFLMLIGWIAYLTSKGSSFELLKTYNAVSIKETFKVAMTNNSWSEFVSYLGLIILITLPIIRVFLTAFLFFKQKEYVLAAIASFVLIALLVSFSLGIEL